MENMMDEETKKQIAQATQSQIDFNQSQIDFNKAQVEYVHAKVRLLGRVFDLIELTIQISLEEVKKSIDKRGR